MYYECVNIRFINGKPAYNTQEASTVHMIDPRVIEPRKPLRAGDIVAVATIGRPILQLVRGRLKEYDGLLSGNIIGRVTIFEAKEVTS